MGLRRTLLLLAILLAPVAPAEAFAPGIKVEVFGTGTTDDGRKGEVIFELTKSTRDVVAFDSSTDVKSIARSSLRLPVAAKPSVPTGLVASTGDAKVDLTWNANPASESVDSYQVYRNDVLIKDGLTSPSYSVTGLFNGTAYSFRVSAHNAAGYGDWTAAVSATPQASAPPPPLPARPAVTFTRINQFDGGSGFAASAVRDEVVALQGFWRRPAITELRNASLSVKVFIYQNVSRATAPDSAGNYNTLVSLPQAQARGWDSGVVDSDSGGRMIKPTYPDGTSTATDYARFACQEFKRKAAESKLAGYAVDGVFLDDDNTSADGTGGASVWNPWMEKVNSILGPCLRTANSPDAPSYSTAYQAMPNLGAAMGQRNLESGGWIARQFQYFDYVYAEFTSIWGNGAAQDQSFLNETFRLMGVAQSSKAVFVAGDVDFGETKSAFGLAMCLIQTQGYCSKGAGVGNTENWYQTYDRAKALGQPSGPAIDQGNGVWTRPFGSKTVTLNLVARTATIP